MNLTRRNVIAGGVVAALTAAGGGFLVASTDSRPRFERTLAPGKYESPRYGTQVTWNQSLWTNWQFWDTSDPDDQLLLDFDNDTETTSFVVGTSPRKARSLRGATDYLENRFWEGYIANDILQLDVRTNKDTVGMLHSFRDRGDLPIILYQEIWLEEDTNPWPIDDDYFWVNPRLWITPSQFNPDLVREALATVHIDRGSPFRLTSVDELIDTIVKHAPPPTGTPVATPQATYWRNLTG